MSALVDLLPPTPQTDERNRAYLIRRAALGDNPTKIDESSCYLWVRATQN